MRRRMIPRRKVSLWADGRSVAPTENREPSAMSEIWKVAGVQMDITLADKQANLNKMAASIGTATAKGARLIVFPECALAGYCFQDFEEARAHAETIPGPSSHWISETCGRHDAYCVYGMLEIDGERLFNACVLVGPSGVIGSYRKVHLPFLGVDQFTTLGDRPFAVFDAGSLRVGMHICYDGAFPEAARSMALQGADLLVLPTNWPPGAECTASFISNARALENHVYFMAVNRVGTERGFRFIGGSRICDPAGTTLTDAAHEREEILYADIDLARPRRKHLIRVPGKHEIWRFADRRPDLYGELVKPVEIERPPDRRNPR
jgi:5-aminopentanamidase